LSLLKEAHILINTVALATNAKNITTTCCQSSAIKPFSQRYWSQRLSCENISTIREDRLSINFFGPNYVSRTEAEVETKKKEFLAQCEEVRLPITFRKIETINIDGEEIDKELYEEVIRNAYFEKLRQEHEVKNQSN
jgi:hypothetical protein